MIYRDFKDKKISLMGFGAMRLPLLEDGTVDKVQVQEMVDMAIENGVNYFDTAWPYHTGQSELVIGEALSKYDRSSFYLADKYPGHQISSTYDPAYIFEKQLEKCRVEYFDFYLYHNVYEKSISVYTDPQWDIIEYFKEQKRLGRIKHLGLSTHAQAENLEAILDAFGDAIEFCQIQLNYLDWSLQKAREKCEILSKRGIPVWVMEPLRGGKLANVTDEAAEQMKAASPEDTPASLALRFFHHMDNVKVVLNGVSNIQQMKENLETFREERKLSEDEKKLLMDIAESMKDSVPCTACRYCCGDCPRELDIPMLLSVYNDAKIIPSFNTVMVVEALPDDKKPAACIACGKCAKVCPQNIDIPAAMKDFAQIYDKIPRWEEISRQREVLQPVTDKK